MRSNARVIAAVILAMTTVSSAGAGALRDGMAAYRHEAYDKAAHLLRPLAQRGDPQAQTYLGFMYEFGRGVPQNYAEAFKWYCLAAEQDYAFAQYQLGLVYDKGFGVKRDYIEAHKWLNLAAAHAPRGNREDWVRVRDAVASKMSTEHIALAERRAEEWRSKRLAGSPLVVVKRPSGRLVIETK